MRPDCHRGTPYIRRLLTGVRTTSPISIRVNDQGLVCFRLKSDSGQKKSKILPKHLRLFLVFWTTLVEEIGLSTQPRVPCTATLPPRFLHRGPFSITCLSLVSPALRAWARRRRKEWPGRPYFLFFSPDASCPLYAIVKHSESNQIQRTRLWRDGSRRWEA